MLTLTAVLVIGQFVLLAAFVLGVVAFFGLIAYDFMAGSEGAPRVVEEPRAYASAPARAA